MSRRSLPMASGPLPKVRWGVLVGALGAGGCIDPKADYQDFAARPLAERDATAADVQQTSCEKLIEEDPSGTFFLSCRPMALPTPFGLSITHTVTRSEDGGAAQLVFSFTPLRFGATNLSET